MPEHTPGTRVGPYELVSLIGIGGMGEVWKARDTRVERTVAIKFAQAAFTERFERESRAIAALNHPNVCHLYDVGPGYLVMEFVDGAPLRPPGDWRSLLDVAAAIAGGLAEAHAAGIVHRDLKPDNILMRADGVIKILDFGLAKRADDDVRATRTSPLTAVGTVVGTVAYMSPEQATGRELDIRSDQFSFGLILYELATGRRPFERPSSAETMAAIIRDEPEPLPVDVPRPVAWVIERCLAKDSSQRYDSTRDLYRELCSVRQHLSEITRAVPVAAGRPATRRRWLRDVALAAVGMAAGALAVGWWHRALPPQETTWRGVRLGGASVSLNPRLSPDGHLLAFIVLANDITELAIMEPGSASWTQLTHSGRQGGVQNVSWSRDGSKLYFDRYTSQAVGVYTMPPLGGRETLLLEKAFQPLALPDGSLLVVRLAGSSDQLFRFWPQNGKLQALPVFFTLTDVAAPVAAFADGRRVAYVGRSSADATQPSALHVLDLDSGEVRTLDPEADIDAVDLLGEPVAVTPDGAAVFTLARHGDTYDLIQVRTDGTPGHRVLMTFGSTTLPINIEATPSGVLYLDQVGRPPSIVQVPANRTGTEQQSMPRSDDGPILALPEGRIVVGAASGTPRLLIGAPGAELLPFLQIDEAAAGPLSTAGPDALALIVGPRERQRIALASVADGHLLQEMPVPAGRLTGLAVSSDRARIYYALNGSLFALNAGGSPRRLAEGDALTLDPSGRYLYAKQFAHDPIRLVRIDTASGDETVIPLPPDRRLAPIPFSPTAIDSNQRMLVDTSSPLTWFYRPAMLDLRSGALTPIPLSFVGDCTAPGWASDGSIICSGVGLTGSLWRYQRTTPGVK